MKLKVKKVDDVSIIIITSIFSYLLILEANLIGNFAVIILLLPITLYPKISSKLGKMEKYLMVYIIYGFILTIVRYKQVYNLKNAFNLLFEYVIVFIACHFIKNYDWNMIIEWLRNFGLLLCGFGIGEGVFKFPILHYWLTGSYATQTYGSDSFRICLIFGRPILCGTMLLFLWGALYCKPFKNSTINLLAHGIFILNILMNKSRSCWIAFALMVVLIVCKKCRKRRVKLKYFKILLMLFVLVAIFEILGIDVVGTIYNSVADRIKGSLEAGTGQIVRIENMISSFNYWFKEENYLDFLIGGGKNYSITFMNAHPVYKGNWKWEGVMDNQYLSIIHDFGIVGFVIFFGIVIVAMERFIKCTSYDVFSIYANTTLLGLSICIFFYEGLNYPLIFWAIFMTIEMSDFAEQKGLICKNVNSEMNCIASGDKINILEDMSEENKA